MLTDNNDKSFLLIRVSSQAMISADFKHSIARGEMSPKLPIGVAMMYKPFFIRYSFFDISSFLN